MPRPHYLHRAIYRPRILAYVFAMAVTLSAADTLPLQWLMLPAILLAYPFIAHGLGRRFANTAKGARLSLRVDAVLVGLLVIANQFHLFAATSFVAALVMSSLLIGYWWEMLVNLALVLMISALGYLWPGESHWQGVPLGLRDWLSGFSVIIYSALIAGMGFQVTTRLGQGRKQLAARHSLASVLIQRLQPYIAPQVYNHIAARRQVVTQRRCLTVCFTDIEGFTRLMDAATETAVTRMLNEYLDAMANVALAHGGTLDKFMGDGMMIFFGDPTSRGPAGDALACVCMALAMRDALADLRQSWYADGLPGELHLRIGIHTGDCAVGNFGSVQRMDYTAIGSVVNIASRLEGQAGRDGVLISAMTYGMLPGQLACQAGRWVSLRGIQEDLLAYPVISLATGVSQAVAVNGGRNKHEP